MADLFLSIAEGQFSLGAMVLANSRIEPVLLFTLGAYVLSLHLSMAGMEIFAWVGVVLVSLHWFLQRPHPRLWLGCEARLWTFVGAAVLSVVLATTSSFTPSFEPLGFFRWIVVLYALTYSLRIALHYRHSKHFFILLCVVLLLSGLYGVWQFFSGQEWLRPNHHILLPTKNGFWRATGFFNISMTYAYSLGMACVFFLALAVRLRGLLRRWSWLVFAVTLAGVVVSLTRGAWVAVALVAFFILWLEAGKRWALSVLIMSLAVMVFGYFFSIVIHDRFVEMIYFWENHSVVVRLNLWLAHWQMFLDHPILGLGWGQVQPHLPEYYERISADEMFLSHPHNVFLQILASTGIIGFFGYIGLCFYFLRVSWNIYFQEQASDWARTLALGALGAQVFAHIGGLTECNFTDGEVTHFMVLIWALTLALRDQPQVWEQS